MVVKPFVTLANVIYHYGDILTLRERTQEAPYGYLSSLGNWVVECPHMVSIWSNIEAAVAEGKLSPVVSWALWEVHSFAPFAL